MERHHFIFDDYLLKFINFVCISVSFEVFPENVLCQVVSVLFVLLRLDFSFFCL